MVAVTRRTSPEDRRKRARFISGWSLFYWYDAAVHEDQTDEATSEHALRSDRDSASLLIYADQGIRAVPLTSAAPVTIGRTAPATVIIENRTLSRRHAKFELIDGVVYVEDLGSRNGTRVSGRRITRARVLPDDQVSLGGLAICVHFRENEPEDLPSLFSHDLFRNIVGDEVERAATFGRRLAIVLVREQGDEVGLRAWYPRVRGLLRPVDRIAQYGSRAMELVLPELNRTEALELARRIASERQPAEPDLVCGVALYPESATEPDALIEACRRALDRASAAGPVQIAPPMADTRDLENSAGGPVIVSDKMQRLYQRVDKLARATIPVLILGETGTGKEVVAQELHQRGPRQAGPLRCVNCAAIPSELLESVLFGHVKGAFTGADQDRQGVFEAADGGTLMLDEVGELSPEAQAALLRVLETRKITRVGSNTEVDVDVRVIAATHRNLDQMAEKGTFRTDLLYRLNAITLQIPPLRERTDEIRPLVDAFLKLAARANDADVDRIAPEALRVLEAYTWPGNIRELRNVIEHCVVVASGSTVTIPDIPDRVRASMEVDESLLPPDDDVVDMSEPSALDFKQRVRALEEALIREALAACHDDKKAVAKALRIPARTLSHKIKTYQLEQPVDLARRVLLAESTAALRTAVPDEAKLDFKSKIQRFEAALIERALEETGGNKAAAARHLKIPLRTLVYKLDAFK